MSEDNIVMATYRIQGFTYTFYKNGRYTAEIGGHHHVENATWKIKDDIIYVTWLTEAEADWVVWGPPEIGKKVLAEIMTHGLLAGD